MQFMSVISRVILRQVACATCLHYRVFASRRLLHVPRKFERRKYDGPDVLSHRRLTVDALTYETISEDTLQSLGDYFDEILTITKAITDADVTYSSGVLNVDLGTYGIYVINKQTPNRQIWLSSPFSGPKRYDFIENTWIYKHDGTKLHDLLNKELRQIFGDQIDFTTCVHAKK